MNKSTIIHKSRKNFETDSEKKIKDLLQTETAQKLKFLNSIQSKKFPNLRSELTNGCIIYKFPLRPQDYRYIYNGKIVPKRCKTLSIQQIEPDAEKNKSKDTQEDPSIQQPIKKRFSINKSITTIESQIIGFANVNKQKSYENNQRRENAIAMMPRFFLQKKSSHTLKRNQSQNVDIKQSVRVRSISHIVSQHFRLPTESLSKDDRFD